MTDEGAGQVGTYAYDAWGNVTASSGAEANEYKFTSRRWEAAVGLQYNRARFYDPQIGRFISPDPLTGGPDDPTISYFGGLYSAFHRFLKEYVDALQPDKLNRYAYCYNNPVNLIDPLGLEGLDENISSSWWRGWRKKAREYKRWRRDEKNIDYSKTIDKKDFIEWVFGEPVEDIVGIEDLKEGDVLLFSYLYSQFDSIGSETVRFGSGGGPFSHAAVYVGNGLLVESIKNGGVKAREITSRDMGNAFVFRLNKKDSNVIAQRATKWLLSESQAGRGYDRLGAML